MMLRPTDQRSLTWFLRLLAGLQMAIFAGAFVPLSWWSWMHAWLGLGPLPDAAVIRYVLRGASFVQGAIGILLWIMASDVVKFRPLIVATGFIYLIASPAFLVFNLVAGMPRFWALMDTISCLVVGVVILGLCIADSKDRSDNPL